MKYMAHIILALVLLYLNTGVAQETPLWGNRCISWAPDPPSPNQPLIDDPDISIIKDQELKRLWTNIVIAYRHNSERLSTVRNMYRDTEYTSNIIDSQDQEYLIKALNRELHAEWVDWNCVYAILVMMEGGMNADSRICDLALYMFQLPRPIKLSDERGASYQHFMYVLRNQHSQEAADLLRDAATREFWGGDPMHSRKLHPRDTEESIVQLQNAAVVGLAVGMSTDISLPLLEELAAMYPPMSEEKVSKKGELHALIHQLRDMVREKSMGLSPEIHGEAKDLLP